MKTSPPQLRRWYPRQRLFDALDQGLERPLVWITAPAGAGKTTLVGSYVETRGIPALWYPVDGRDHDAASFYRTFRELLDFSDDLPVHYPEHLGAPGTFARQFFAAVYDRLEPRVIVLDDVHEVPDDSPWWIILRDGIAALPRGFHLIGISRCDVPPALARRRAAGDIEVLGWQDLRLTTEETMGVARALEKPRTEAEARALQRATDGWAAGVVLTLEWMRLTGQQPGFHPSDTPAAIFDYFASEVLDKLDDRTRRFLTTTAIPPVLTAEIAALLTGELDSGETLEQLDRNNFFTDRRRAADGVTYHYHPLFRTFLVTHGRKALTEASRRELERRAVSALASGGHHDQAIELAVETRSWDLTRELVRQEAPGMVEQGRFQTLERWIAGSPAEKREEDGWLLYWRAVARAKQDPSSAIDMLAQARACFEAAGDAEGAYLAWAEWIETCAAAWDVLPLDRALEELGALRSRFGPPHAACAERVVASTFLVLMWRNPTHPELADFAARARESARTASAARRTILLMNLWLHHSRRGELAQADSVAGEAALAGVGPLAEMIAATLHGHNAWMVADLRAADAHFRAALEICERSGVAYWRPMIHNGLAATALMRGDAEEAARHLAATELMLSCVPPFQESFYYATAVWAALQSGRADQAMRFTARLDELDARCPRVTERCYRLAARAQVCFALGAEEEAEGLLGEAEIEMREQEAKSYELLVQSTRAYFCLERGQDDRARRALAAAFRRAREDGRIWTPMWRHDVLSRLCERALEWGIEPDFTTRLIQRYALVPRASVVKQDAWPWGLCIFTMGRFRVLRDGEALSLGSKAKRRPQELLKVLVSLGGRDVPTAQLCDQLWPDADGDAGLRNFHVTLHRLRGILEDPALLQLRDGKLSLAPGRCWVDVWELEDLFHRLEQHLAHTTAGDKDPDLDELAGRLLELYGGPLMGSEGSTSWCLAKAERLQRQFVRLAGRIGGALEQRGRWNDALTHYERCLERGERSEAFYQGLMRVELALGDPTGAAIVFRQCEKVLHDSLGLKPSPASWDLLAKAEAPG